MTETDSLNSTLLAVSKVLIRCFFMGIVILVFWGGLILLAGDAIYALHNRVYPMLEQQFFAIHYALIALTKIFVFLFFLLPYVSIKLVLLKN